MAKVGALDILCTFSLVNCCISDLDKVKSTLMFCAFSNSSVSAFNFLFRFFKSFSKFSATYRINSCSALRYSLLLSMESGIVTICFGGKSFNTSSFFLLIITEEVKIRCNSSVLDAPVITQCPPYPRTILQ